MPKKLHPKPHNKIKEEKKLPKNKKFNLKHLQKKPEERNDNIYNMEYIYLKTTKKYSFYL